MLKIREIDARIIKSLLQDGRRPFSEIAKENGVTKNKVWKHFREMEKKGVITGATVQMNFVSFGYDALATLLISVEAHRINQVMDYVKKIQEIRAYRQYNSIYNVRAVATLKDINELDHIKEAIRRRLPTNGLRTYIWTDVRNIPENLRLITTAERPAQRAEALEPNPEPRMQNAVSVVDKLDTEIVDNLASDGRSSFSNIARRIGTSTDTVVKRCRKLTQCGAMKVSIQIDPNKLGYHSILDFNISFSSPPDNTSETVESLARIPDVVVVTKTSGDFDLQLTAMVTDIEDMFNIQDQIARTLGVTKIDTSARKIPTKWPTPRQYISTF